MLDRRFLLAICAGCCALAAGCLLDYGPYQSAADGAAGNTTNTAGSAGEGGTTSSTTTDTNGTAGSAGTAGSGGTTTTTQVECMTAAECADKGPCQTRDCFNNQCKWAPVQQGTPIPGGDPDMSDCIQSVCDGNGSAV